MARLRIGPLDLRHQGREGAVGCYVLETREGLALVDCGPSSCFDDLTSNLAAHGIALTDIEHVLLTHIHLDHAGAAGLVLQASPRAQVHVSPIGLPHVVDPSRLEASARRLYGDAFDTLWGAIVPVAAERVHATGDAVLGLECFPTPGHASHHVSYLDDEGTLYTGDVAGVRIAPGSFVLPPTPAPDIDLEAWETSIRACVERQPERLALIHFGVFADVDEHIDRLRTTLARWAECVEHGATEAEFTRLAVAEIEASDPDLVARYDDAVTIENCFGGLERYWRKKREAETAQMIGR